MSIRKKYIVTGGCGFIGSHLVERLISDGSSVIIIDDLSTGHISNLGANKDEVDLRISKVEDLNFEEFTKVDGVFHLAAQASVPLSIDNFFESSKTNILSSLKVIEFCINHRISLVYATSSAVYGNMPFGIETGGVQLLSPYAADKYAMELYLSVANELHRLPSFGLRFFNVYGPRQDASSPYSGVISLFIDKLLKGQLIIINGGYQTRDFIFVKDVVECLILAHKYLLDHDEARVSNILTGTSITINDLVQYISNILKIKPECEYRELPAGDPASSEGSTELLQSLFKINTETFVKVDKGLVNTIEWARTI